MTDLVYVYGFIPADSSVRPDGLAGQCGRPVEILDAGPVRAVIGRVPVDLFAAAPLDARLRDLGWVAERGLEHERVVAWFVDHGDIVPVPLFTIYTGTEALRTAVGPRAGEIVAQLRRFRGLREWDLKVGYDADLLTRHVGELSEEIRAFDGELAAAPPGRRYLLEKKRATVAAGVLSEVARREAMALLDALAGKARDVRSLPLPRADHDLPVVLHAALLLDDAGEPVANRTVADRRAELGRVGISVDWSGPWAPYRFLAAADA